MLYSYKQFTPKLSRSVFVAANATVIGDVEIGDEASIWFNAVVRGDVSPIRIGSKSNIQDGTVLHATLNKSELNIGVGVTVGHAAILHGCTVEDYCLIGMGACVLDNATVGRHSIVAAGALVLEGQEIPPKSLVAGVPAVFKRPLTDKEIEEIRRSADRYITYKQDYMSTGVRRLDGVEGSVTER